MRVQRFSGATMQEALARVKAALGPDAVVVATRSINGGIFRAPEVEITAALEAATSEAAPSPAVERLETRLQALQREIGLIRGVVDDRRGSDRAALARLAAGIDGLLASVARPVGQPSAHRWVERLVAAEVDRPLAERLVAGIPADGAQDAAAQHRAVQAALAAALPAINPSQRDRGRVVAVVGPTGVGKTTTLAKLAAAAALGRRERIAFVTLDTYRVGAVDHLRHYAELLGASVHVCRAPSELAGVCARLGRCDRIFIDTPGRGRDGGRLLARLGRALGELPSRQVLLCLAAATRQAEIVDLASRLAVTRPTALVVTKLDEALALGAMLTACAVTGLAIAWTTAGQRVPEDLEPADPGGLAQAVLRRSAFGECPDAGNTVTADSRMQEASSWA